MPRKAHPHQIALACRPFGRGADACAREAGGCKPHAGAPARVGPLLLALALGAALTSLLVQAEGAAQSGGNDKNLKQNAEQLEKIHNRMQALNASIEADRGKQDALQEALQKAEQAVNAGRADVQKLAADVDAQNSRLQEAEHRRNDADRRLREEKAALAAQLRAAYLIGGGGREGLVMNQDDPGRVARMVGYYDYFDRARAQRMATIQTELAQLAELERQVQDQFNALKELQNRRQRALAELQSRRSERAQALTALKQRLAGAGDELGRLQASEKQVQKLMESLKRALIDTPFEGTGESKPFPQLRGKLPWPLRGPLLATYGEAKTGGHLQWKGLWIGAEEGSAIHASARGRVAYVGWMSRYGLIVVLEHEGGYFTLYGHAATVSHAAGDTVAAGEVIATAGSTGGYEQPGLYFEIRKGTDPLNPKEWLKP